MIADKLTKTIREIPDFPKPGIMFKDITPVLADPELSAEVGKTFFGYWKDLGIQGVVGIESRGFIYGSQLAQKLRVPFVPIRKAGKLPFKTIKHSYDLEYGSAEMEVHTDAISNGQRILIHDDLLATGGTARVASELVKKMDGKVVGFSFLVELGFLKGARLLGSNGSVDIQSLVTF